MMEAYPAGLHRQHAGTDDSGRPGEQPGADLPGGYFVFTGVVYYLLCSGIEQLAKR